MDKQTYKIEVELDEDSFSKIAEVIKGTTYPSALSSSTPRIISDLYNIAKDFLSAKLTDYPTQFEELKRENPNTDFTKVHSLYQLYPTDKALIEGFISLVITNILVRANNGKEGISLFLVPVPTEALSSEGQFEQLAQSIEGMFTFSPELFGQGVEGLSNYVNPKTNRLEINFADKNVPSNITKLFPLYQKLRDLSQSSDVSKRIASALLMDLLTSYGSEMLQYTIIKMHEPDESKHPLRKPQLPMSAVLLWINLMPVIAQTEYS